MFAPIQAGEIFLRQRPPDVDDEKDREQEPAKQDGRVASPDFFERSTDNGHMRNYSSGVLNMRKVLKGYTYTVFTLLFR